MAEDEKDPETGASPEGNDVGGDASSGDLEETQREWFVDRDDDSSPGFIDSDYGDDFPESEDEPEDVDPGYAAFASELEDPLADWPAPDVPLDELPEVRQQKEASVSEITQSEPLPDSTAEASDEEYPVTEFPEDVNGSLDELVGDESDQNGDDLLFEPSSNDMDSSSATMADGDYLSGGETFDESPANTDPVEPEDPIEPEPAQAIVPDEPSDGSDNGGIPSFGDSDSYREPELTQDEGDANYLEESPVEQTDTFSENEEHFEEEFVDDFLNDLDPPEEEELPAVEDYEEEFDSTLLATTMAASSVERAAPFESQSMTATDSDEPMPTDPIPVTAPENEAGSTPWGMIAVVGVALVLLAIGGFGVMQQRGDMQAEIRELQAKLATTVSPEEAGMERERQRQVQLQNESLSTELEALTAENDALSQRLEELESLQLAQANAAAEKLAQEEAAAKAAAERAARQAAEQAAAKSKAASPSGAASSRSTSTAKGPWFVNFGSYADRGIADQWANKLTVSSGEVVVQTATAAGKTLYRVRVIGLSNQDSAERVATALERQYQLPRLWVGKN